MSDTGYWIVQKSVAIQEGDTTMLLIDVWPGL